MKKMILALPLLLVSIAVYVPAQSTSGGLPSEPGMYVATPNGAVRILGQSVSFKRSGSKLVSGVTLGIKAQKENVQLIGAHAQTSVSDNPEFYFIPAKQESEMGVSAGDLVMIHLEEEEDRRHFEVGAKGIGRESAGISITHQIQIAASEAQPGIYKVTAAAPLEKGEYALYLNRGERLPPYVYDFSVGSGEPTSKFAESSPVRTATAAAGSGKCSLQSVPDGADISVDGGFAGNTPSTISLTAGKHTITVSAKGYRNWERDITIAAGSEITLKATLER